VIALRNNVESINADTLNNELEKLKSQKPDDQILQEFKFDEASEEKFVKAYKQSVSK
jgi:exonuclease III